MPALVYDPLVWQSADFSHRQGRTDISTRSRFQDETADRRRTTLRLAALSVGLILTLVLGTVVQASSVITHGSRERPWVALTFDDGWSIDRCTAIIHTLRAKRATATFFINGAYMKRDPKRWRSLLQGFPVANHTLNHPWLTRLSEANIRVQIATNERVVEGIVGRPMLHLLRPPYGAYDSRVVRIGDNLGYRTILWDIDSGDTSSGTSVGSVIRYGRAGGKGAIVLMHCGPSVTPPAVASIIDSYRSRGYKLVDLGAMLHMGPPAGPARPARACRVRDIRTGRTMGRLRKAAAAASAGDTLTLQGICRGVTTLAKDLTIKGISTKTSGPPTLAGMGRGTVLTVRADARVKVRALTIRGGVGSEGGGILNRGTLTLRDVSMHSNRATSGGGILNVGHLALLGSSSVRNNTATKSGGGILNRGTLTGVVCGGNVHGNTPDDCAEGE